MQLAVIREKRNEQENIFALESVLVYSETLLFLHIYQMFAAVGCALVSLKHAN